MRLAGYSDLFGVQGLAVRSLIEKQREKGQGDNVLLGKCALGS
jgi:hypothetical protein